MNYTGIPAEQVEAIKALPRNQRRAVAAEVQAQRTRWIESPNLAQGEHEAFWHRLEELMRRPVEQVYYTSKRNTRYLAVEAIGWYHFQAGRYR